MSIIEENEVSKEVKIKDEKRSQTLGEEIGNAITHGLGAVFGIVAIILFLVNSNYTLEYLSALFFGISIFILYLMSCLYHAFKKDTKVKRLFRIFDHSAIYLLIGGTYAPIFLLAIGGTVGLVLFIVQWGIIIFLIALKIARPGKNTLLLIIFSLILGWSGIGFMPTIHRYDPLLFWMILSGGLAYSIGVFFFVSDWKYSHFIWHFFVLAGTILHFIGVFAVLIL